jgi:sodium transport system permease protein
VAVSAILTVLRKELRESLRELRTVCAALLFGPVFVPILFAGMLAFSLRHSETRSNAPIRLAVSHVERAPNLVSELAAHGVAVVPVRDDDAQARAAVETGRYAAILLIPRAYGREMAASAPAPLRLYMDSSNGSEQALVLRVRALIAQYDDILARLRLLARGVDPLVLSPIALQNVDVATPAGRSARVLGMITFLIILSMLMGGFYLAIDATAGERERGSLEPLLTLPVPREHLIYGKILASCVLMLVSLALTVASLTVALRLVGLERFGMSVNLGPLSALAIIGCCAPLAPLGAALMTIVAAFTRSYREAQTYLGVAILVPTLPLVFASVADLQPTNWTMAVPALGQHFLVTRLLKAEPIPPLDLALSVVTTLAVGAVLGALAGRLYRRESLLG